ncbi:DCN1-like protein 3 isoform X2 [Hetaerina americana]|uniref:DCN1-like protein 3 isoform X2 n=1 Tax=Hetaerina americana TaxID=62018 RepID=UPI003A7F5F75
MGKCISCIKIPPSSDSSSQGGMEKDKDEEMDAASDFIAQENQNALTFVDSQSNGNSKVTGISFASEKRLFCPRIPPLGRTYSGESGGKRTREASESKINALFDQYKDSVEENSICAEGIEKLCSDLGVNPADFKILGFAWKLSAEQMCKFTREEFVNGLRNLKVDSIGGIRNKLPEIVAEVRGDAEKFKDLYRFTFRFGLDTESGQRILPLEMAIDLWQLVFSQREPAILNRWLCFLDKHPNVRGIPRDTWNMFLNFTETVGDDLGCYDDTEAWPSLFDDFVEYENDQMNQNISKDKDEMKEVCD